MKGIVSRSVQILALLVALALPGFAEESKRGFFEGNLPGNGRVVFFVQGNHAVSAYLFDASGGQASFAGGRANNDGTFSLQTNSGQTITGTIGDSSVTATFSGQNITANRVSPFGQTENLAGRFSDTGEGNGSSLDVKVVIDSQGNIFLITKNGTQTIGGFGSIVLTDCASPTPSPSATASASPSATASASPTATASATPSSTPEPTETPKGSATPTPSATPEGSASPTPTASPDMRADDEGGDDNANDGDNHGQGGDHDFEDQDEREDHDEDQNQPEFCANFTITAMSGGQITGHITFSHGLLLGEFTLNGVTFHFRAPQESAENHLANISTRGFVNTGQGQLIGGFIITGGPKLVMIRALGPSLASEGVSPVLANPKLELFQDSTKLGDNDDWQQADNADDMKSTTIAPNDPKEAAMLIRLEPGHYTTIVTGADGGTGIALVEVFEIDRD